MLDSCATPQKGEAQKGEASNSVHKYSCTRMKNPESCRQPSRTLQQRQLGADRGRMHIAAGRAFTRRMARVGRDSGSAFGSQSDSPGEIRLRPMPKRYRFVIARKFESEGSGAQDKCCETEWGLRAEGCQQGARHLALGILFIPPAHTFDEKRRSVQ